MLAYSSNRSLPVTAPSPPAWLAYLKWTVSHLTGNLLQSLRDSLLGFGAGGFERKPGPSAIVPPQVGRVLEPSGAELSYGKPGFKNPEFIARGRDA